MDERGEFEALVPLLAVCVFVRARVFVLCRSVIESDRESGTEWWTTKYNLFPQARRWTSYRQQKKSWKMKTGV